MELNGTKQERASDQIPTSIRISIHPKPATSRKILYARACFD
jgi:pyoverdine/dityrosine biosynthesis protein Dit1